MRLHKFISLLLLSGLISGVVFAKDLSAVVKLADIKAERTSGKGRDDLYFEVTQYPNLERPSDERLPRYPLHWVSDQLPRVKNVVLWAGQIPRGESIKLILSLVEQEFSPWAIDDLLGSAQLILINEDGKLKKVWSLPNFEKSEAVKGEKGGSMQRYIFKGDSSRYDVAFLVEQK